MSRASLLAIVAIGVILGLSSYPNTYAWNASPEITFFTQLPAEEIPYETVILEIQFDYSEISNPPSGSNYPTEFQVRTSTDGSSWSEYPSVPIRTPPTTAVFTEIYNLGPVSEIILVQARLNSNTRGWSDWGPAPPVTVPEFPFQIATLTGMLAVTLGGLALFRSRRLKGSG